MRRIRPSVSLLGLVALGALTGCEPPPESETRRSGPELAQREDGRMYQPGAEIPFTGVQRVYAGEDKVLSRETAYFEGQKEGFERRWFKDGSGQLRQQTLWVRGAPTFHWQWYPNGQLEQISSQGPGEKAGRESIAFGSYVKFFDDGRVKFRGHYDAEFRWHGPVLDYGADGGKIWDAEFEHGTYLRGFGPEEVIGGDP